jgi:hypothetical protein
MDANHTMTAIYVAPLPVIRTLTVNSSNPSSGVAITVSPPDNSAQGNGTTSFTRNYNDGSGVNLTAAASAGGNNFQKWHRDGVDFSFTAATTPHHMDANHTMTAIYVAPPPVIRTLTVNSSNPSGGSSHHGQSPRQYRLGRNGTTSSPAATTTALESI